AAALGEDVSVVSAVTPAAYEPGLLALREGPLLEAAVRGLSERPDVLLVDATGRDHPRRAGLALQLGAVLDLPTVGVTDRPLLARGEAPAEARGSASPLLLEGERVGYLVRTRTRARPIAVHAGHAHARAAADGAGGGSAGARRRAPPMIGPSGRVVRIGGACLLRTSIC